MSCLPYIAQAVMAVIISYITDHLSQLNFNINYLRKTNNSIGI